MTSKLTCTRSLTKQKGKRKKKRADSIEHNMLMDLEHDFETCIYKRLNK